MSEENMTPPTGKTSKPKPGSADSAQAAKPPKAANTPKAEGDKKPRAPRVDYGYHPQALIMITDKENKFRGQRLDWYESIVPFDGKNVREWEETRKGVKNGQGNVQSPRGFLRRLVLEGAVELVVPEEVRQQEQAEAAAKAEKKEAGAAES